MKRQETPRVGQKIADVFSEGGGLIAKMSLWLQQQLRLLGRNPQTAVDEVIYDAISPHVHYNATDFDQDVLIAGGTVTAVGFSRDNGASYHDAPLSGFVRLNPGDSVRVAFSVAPSITIVPR